MLPRLPAAALGLFALLSTSFAVAAESASGAGSAIYQVNCSACHQPNGEGVKGIFPPLARSDFLLADKERSIRIALQGYSGPITVNGTDYQGVMPPPPAMDDQQAADVLSYVRNSWGNSGEPVTAAEVAKVRASLSSADANAKDPYAPLPKAPAGYKLREVVKLPAHGIRLATMPGVDWLLVLNNGGELYRLEPATGNLSRLLVAKDYADTSPGNIDALGMTIDSKKRLYIVTNQRVAETPHHINRVVIYRSEPLGPTGVPGKLKAWLRTSYPWGNSYYNHGVSHIAEGPDGMMYVSSGARTDGGETDGGAQGKADIYWKGGETDYTAALWRIDPNAEVPKIEVFARGIRNAWSFQWNDRGELFSVTNGPDADMPEEMDLVEKGKHYGFPYQFSDFPATLKPYPYTPAAPPGLVFTPAIRSFGPAAGGTATKPMATFDAHSSPAGMIFCGPDWPAAQRGKFLIGRFGNLIREIDVGYDLVSVGLKRNASGVYEAQVDTFLAPLARPVDILQVGKKLYIIEYTRPLSRLTNRPMNPGRILELSW